MTGFARVQGHDDRFSWTWEVKSVNGKGRDVRCRLAGGFDFLEIPARDKVSRRFQRGSITLNLQVVRSRVQAAWRINREALDQVIRILPEIEEKVATIAPSSADGILGLRGVMEPLEEEPSDEVRAAVETRILEDLDEAIDNLAAMRAEEGERLAPVLSGLADEIESLQAKARTLAAVQPGALRARLVEQVRGLVGDMPEDRLAQEVALLAAKADLREELDRLTAHVAAARDLLVQPGAVGRKLDFLCQEFNREANTLCSKSSDVELTRIGLDLKVAIEQFREQVQNIE